MTLDAAILNIQKIQDALPKIMGEMAVLAVSNAKETIQTRVQTTGKTARYPNLFMMSPYSESYRQYKIDKNRVLRTNPNLNFVDLTFTGDMWRGIGLVGNTETTATLGGQNPGTIKKLVELEHYKGFALDISDLELEHLEEEMQDDFNEKIMKLLPAEMRVQ
jgi:hypothetical protein